VIGAALLAFIIEVGIEAIGRSGGNSAAANVGNEKIDIMAFQRRVEQEAANDQNNQQTDAATRQQQVLDDMINEMLLEQEYEKLGIYVSDKEISELMIGKNPAPAVAQFAQQAGAQSPAELYDFIMNPGKQGVQEAQVAELRNQWNKLKDEITKQYKFSKLQGLIAGCMQANDLDRAQMKADEAMTNVITFVKKDYASLPDDKYAVSDEELKAEWQKMKPLFKTEEDVRRIHYIAVNIDPSKEDIAAAQKIADAAYIALQKGRGIDSVRLLGTVQIDTAKMLQKEIPAKVRDLFASAEVGTTRRDSTVGNHHVMYKLINKEVSLDSVEISYVIAQGDAKFQKSILDQLNAGKSLDELKKANAQKVDGKLNEWQRIFNAPDSMKAKIANAGEGYFVYNSVEQGATLMKVENKKAAKTFYTVATVTYDAYASTKTSDMLRDKFQDFLNKNKTAKAFEENAAKAGFNAIEMLIVPSTPQIGLGSFGQSGIKDSRKAIKWAFDNKKDMVSPIFSDNNNVLIAVAIDDIYEDGYLPLSFGQVKDMVTKRIRNSKKGDDLVKQYQGKAKDLNGYAAVMGAKVDTVNIVFASNGDPKLGNEPGLVGRMSVAKQGSLQGPWKGENAVFVYQVVKQEKSNYNPTKEELDNRYAQRRGSQMFANPRMVYNILSKATKVKKHLIDFY
jgi:peptidyl-prolyl cis-trans isomerase D